MYKCALIIMPLIWSFSPIGVNAQYSNKEIDSLIGQVANQYRLDGKWKEGLEVYNTTLEAAKQNNYRKGIVESYMNIGNLYYMLGNSTASVKYLDTALAVLKGLGDKVLETRVLSEFGKNYFHFNQPEKSLQYFDRALAAAAGIKEEQVRVKTVHYIYAIQASVYEKNNQISKFYQALENAYNTSPNPLVASRMTRYFLLYNKNLDSARTYIEKANKMWETGNYPVHQRSILLRNEGLYNYTIKDYPRAIELYRQSIAISQKLGNKEEEMNTYNMLSELYAKMENTKSKDSTLAKADQLEDSLENDKATAVINPVTHTMPPNTPPGSNSKGKQGTIWFAALLAIPVLVLLYFILRRKELPTPKA